MSKIPTAEDFSENFELHEEGTNFIINYSEVYKFAIEFAKLHVEAAIKACIEDAPSGSSTDTVSYEDVVEALKDSYPLTNIK